MRLSVGIASCLTFILVEMGPSVSYADPGAMTEVRREGGGVMDPVVERVRIAIGKRVVESTYSVRILNFTDYLLLQGEVDSEQGREQILSVAREVGAKPVRDELRLRPALTDEQIASGVRQALTGEHPSLAKRIKVEVREGTAYLTGDLRNHREVDELLSTTLMVAGVRDIRSDITLAGRPYTTQRIRAR